VAACRGLTELTVTYPHPHDTSLMKTRDLLTTAETARSAALQLINVCKTLSDFDTIQIVYFLPGGVLFQRRHAIPLSSEQASQILREQVKVVTDLAIDCLKEPGTRCRQGEGRKIMVRVIELSPDHPRLHLGPAKVEEHEV